jgi:hypothetical protein
MLKHTTQPIKSDEIARLNRITKRQDLSRDFVDCYQISVEKCFIPINFNEELPLYLLDLGEEILILFGQWLFDPHTTVMSADIFESWKCEQGFFTSFSMRCSLTNGNVFEMSVREALFTKTQRLNQPLKFQYLHEMQLIRGSGKTLVADLQSAGLIQI